MSFLQHDFICEPATPAQAGLFDFNPLDPRFLSVLVKYGDGDLVGDLQDSAAVLKSAAALGFVTVADDAWKRVAWQQ